MTSKLAAQLEQREDLLGAGQDRELLGLERRDATLLEHLTQVVLHLTPAGLERALGVDLLPVKAGVDLGRLIPQRDPEGVGE
jgi:hypothetical protein